MSRNRFIAFCLAVALVPAAARAVELTDADAILRFAAEKNVGYDSYTAAVAQSINIPAMKMDLTGSIAFKRPAQRRVEMKGTPQHMVMVIGPDQIMWQEVVIGSMTNVMKLDLQNVPTNHPAAAMLKDSLSQMDPRAQFDKAKERYTFMRLPAIALQSQQMYVLAGELRPDAKLPAQEAAILTGLGKQKLFIGQQDGFLHRMEQLDKAGSNIVIAIEFTDVKLNLPLTDNLFIYKPSADANVIDMSQMILRMMGRPPKSPAGSN